MKYETPEIEIVYFDELYSNDDGLDDYGGIDILIVSTTDLL